MKYTTSRGSYQVDFISGVIRGVEPPYQKTYKRTLKMDNKVCELVLILSDTPTYDENEFLLFPQYILGKNMEAIRCVIGKPHRDALNDGLGTFGVYVSISDEDKIDYTKCIMLWHDTDLSYFQETMYSLLDIRDDSPSGHHIHISKFFQNDIPYK